jgi:hypothetical protein
MRYVFCILVFHAASLFTVLGQTLSRSDTETNTLNYQTRDGDKVTLSVRNLLYKDKDGDTLPTQDRYVFELINGRYPRIADYIYGEDLSFQLSRIGGTNRQELLIFYHTGGNMFGVKIYRIDGVDIIPLKTQPFASNMDSIQFKGEDIIVENQEFNNDDSITFYTDTYRVVDDGCKLLKEEKDILPPSKK